MKTYYSRSTLRRALITALAALGLFSLSLAPRPAFALFGACHSDPLITLTNLQEVHVTADIYDSQSDVKSVTYVVHIPAGLHVLSIINTDSLIGLKEHVYVYADDTAHTVDTYTTISTGQRSAVTATTGVGVVPLFTYSASGYSGQSLAIHQSTSLL